MKYIAVNKQIKLKVKKLKTKTNNILTIENDAPEITLVYPPVVDWYLLYQRPQQLFNSFSKIKNVRCIFISNEAFKKLSQPITRIRNNLYVVKANTDYNHLVKGKKILWLSYPPYYYYSEDNFDFVVFDAIDIPKKEFVFWAKDLDKAISCANIISCTSEELYNYYKKFSKPIFMCPNGTDYEHFKIAQNKLKKPSDFPNFKANEKVIGYYGAFASWLNYKLISKIADKYKVVMIGKNKHYNREIIHPNIVTLEHKDYSQLPYYLSHFDIAMIPFKLTDMIKGCDPIKFYEYISAGKPVVTTEIPELKNRFSHITYFMNYENCHRIIEKAIKEDCLSKRLERIKVAKENSWDARVKTAYMIILKYLFKT